MNAPQHDEENAGPAPPALIIDALGRPCPVPVILLAGQIGDVQPGELVEVLTDDPVAQTDLPAWCALKSHDLLRVQDRPAGWSFLIRRPPRRPPGPPPLSSATTRRAVPGPA